jgi:lipopolysaccharide transport protein LptA
MVVLCQLFEYDPATRTARYRDNALLRSGSDEIRAPLIAIEEPAEGQRRLHAEGGVVSTFHPRAKPGAKKAPAAVEVRSEDLLYEEKAGRIVYTGAVEIRQGDILTKSPRAVALLTPGGSALERLEAGSPVEVRQGARRATGDEGRYTPQDETLVLVGDAVVLEDPERSLSGRILTFQVGGDRIRVDGRDEERSEAVFRRRDPERP